MGSYNSYYIPVSLLINLTIIVTIVKKKSLRKPLNLIHLCMLTVNCLIAVPDVITSAVFVPNAIRSCECSRSAGLAYFVTEQLYIAFQPLNIASLALFMLLTIKGRKRLVFQNHQYFNIHLQWDNHTISGSE